MKIYFCGAITGGRQDQPIYAQLIAYLEGKHGEVLTKQVGDPALTITGDEGISEAEIYRRDLDWLRDADVVVAEVTVPSHGVGVELAKAEEWEKPVLCLFRDQPDRPPSPFVTGNAYFTFRKYGDVEQAEQEIDAFLETLED